MDYGKKFSSKGLIESNLEALFQEEIVNGTGHLIILVMGGSNTGKTSFSLLAQQYLNNGEVRPDWIALDHDEWLDIYTTRDNPEKVEAPKKRIVYEEARDSFFRTDANTKQNKEAKNKVYKYRSFQNILFINFQNAADLAPFLILNNVADGMFRCVRPGKVEFYAQQTMKQMWYNDRSRKFKGWKSQKADFKDWFKNPEKLIHKEWEQYEKSNLEKLDGTSDEIEEPDNTTELNIKKEQVKVLQILQKNKECSTSDLVNTVYSSQPSVHRGMKKLIGMGFVSKQMINGKNRYRLTSKGEGLIEVIG